MSADYLDGLDQFYDDWMDEDEWETGLHQLAEQCYLDWLER